MWNSECGNKIRNWELKDGNNYALRIKNSELESGAL
jgi:hypothetical protein